MDATITEAAARFAAHTGVATHDVLVVLGSGWSAVTDVVDGVDVPTADLGGFAEPGVGGHRGIWRSARVGTSRVILARGRVHLYEGHAPKALVHGIRVAAAAGCRVAVLTNAAGVLNTRWPVGSTALIADQINMTGISPLEGAAHVDLSDLYSRRLRLQVGGGLPEGVYVGTHGPEFETPAEIRAYASMGADLVGMSTVLEAIAAKQAGMEVLGISLITNLAAGLAPSVDVAEVWEVSATAGPRLGNQLVRVLGTITS
jgi:purine-nucleoside phosphorylase